MGADGRCRGVAFKQGGRTEEGVDKEIRRAQIAELAQYTCR
jgi:hypothetical protein